MLKSWWNRGKEPPVYYYRDKDGKEIDLLLKDRTIHPVEIKKSANPRRRWVRQFAVLDRLKPRSSDGGVVCLCRERLPITESISAIPVGVL